MATHLRRDVLLPEKYSFLYDLNVIKQQGNWNISINKTLI